MSDLKRTVLVVDDEAPARERLRRLVDELDGYDVIAEAGNGLEALEAVNRARPDILLLDIRMPEMDGLEVARHLTAMAEPPAVIFTTAYDQYAFEAFESEAIGYLLKPVRQWRLERALEIAARLTRNQLEGLPSHNHPRRQHVSARVGDAVRLVPVNEIQFFRADQKYVTVYHMGGEEIIDESLKTLAEELAPEFVRIHRSFLVAVSAIQRMQRDAEGRSWVKVREYDELLPVSRRQAADLKRQIS
jgi:two-component system response regulator AlgR